MARHTDAEIEAAVVESLRSRRRPLAGWTLGVKDVIDTADLPTERGSSIYAGRRSVGDATCVALARAAGAVVAGKTATTEFALFTPTVTTNPHDQTRTPGGSSSGSAAAVADGHIRAAFGTQTVGSVIRPAAFCGVVGFKPTPGFVPMTGIGHLAPSFDTLGWLTRSVADASTMFDALAGPSVTDEAQPVEAESVVRIGRYLSHQWPSAQPELGPILDAAAGRLADATIENRLSRTAVRTEIVDVDDFGHLDGVFEAANVVLLYEVVRVFAWERQHHNDQLASGLQKMLDQADGVTADDYAEAKQTIEVARTAHSRQLAKAGIDALLTPSSPGEAPTIETTGDSVFNRTWTSVGVPAIHLPTGTGPSQLPVGIQLAGVSYRDRNLLHLATLVEAVLS